MFMSAQGASTTQFRLKSFLVLGGYVRQGGLNCLAALDRNQAAFVLISDMTVLLCGSTQTHLGTSMPSGGGHIISPLQTTHQGPDQPPCHDPVQDPGAHTTLLPALRSDRR